MKRILVCLLLAAVLFGCGGAPSATPTAISTRSAAPTIPVVVQPTATSAPTTATVASATAASTLVPPTAHPTIAPLPTSNKPAIQTPSWFNETVLYEIFPRSYEDANGDGIGDLKGIASKLDYLKDLGIGAIWLTPIFASPSYHGYDTTDYYKINPDFGTEQDLVDLVKQAHDRNIRIILDFVAGHTSDQHPFFKDAYGNPQSKYANWYRWQNDAHTSYAYFGASPDLPSLNQDNPETRAYLIDAAKYWIDKANIDGYRLDYALGVSHDFWKAFRSAIKAEHPDFLLLGEVWTSGLNIVPYYDNEFDATFDFPTYFDLMGSHEHAGSSTLLGKGSPAGFESSIKAETRLYNPGAESVRFLNNHDTLRVASQLQNVEREKLAATLLLTLPSTPMIYYGEEIGMMGDKSGGDQTLREPMDWYASETGAGMATWYKPTTRFNKPNDGVSIQEEQSAGDSLLDEYKRLIEMRANHPALRDGEFIALSPKGSDQAIAFLRRDASELDLIVANTSDKEADFTLDLGGYHPDPVILTNAIWSTTSGPLPANPFPMSLPPRSAFVYRLN